MIKYILIITTFCMASASYALDNKDTNLHIVELGWQTPSLQETTKKVEVLAELMDLQIKAFTYPRTAKEGLGKWQAIDEQNPQYKVKIHDKHNEIKVINTEISDLLSEKDIGEENALEIADGLLSSLRRGGLLNGLEYNPKNHKIGYHILGEGSLDGKDDTRAIVEYRVTYLAEINGVPLANAGVRVAVHRSGQVSGIRMGGVALLADKTRKASAKVTQAQIRKSFDASIPKGLDATIAWDRIMYAMPEGETRSLVAPMYIFSYSLTGKSDDSEVVSRRKIVGYSLIDENKVVDFTTPSSKHESTDVSRISKEDIKRHKLILEKEDHPH